MKKLLIILTFLISSVFFVNNVNAEEYKSFDYTFTNSVGYTNNLVTEITNSGTSIQDETLFMNGSSYIKYNLVATSYLDIRFKFKKNGSASYPRLLYMGGINREIEVKGASKNMYINGEYTTTWAQNEWNTMRILLSDNSIKYYVNDVLVKTEDYSGTITFLQFGQGSSTDNRFTGYIDDLKLIVSTAPHYVEYSASELNEVFKINANVDDSNPYNKKYNYNYLNYYKTKFLTTYTEKGTYYYCNLRTNLYNQYCYVFNDLKQIYSLGFGKIIIDADSSKPIYRAYLNSSSLSWTNLTESVTIDEEFGTEVYGYSNIITSNVPYITYKAFNSIVFTDGITIEPNGNYKKSESGILQFKESLAIPKITITKERETSVTTLGQKYITDMTLKIEFSLVDNSKFLYMYKYGENSDWVQLVLNNSNSKEVTFYSNDRLYVQVIDITTNKQVALSTLDITSINNIIEDDSDPTLSVGIIDDDKCIVNGIKLCVTYHISSNITNFDRYSIYITNDNKMTKYNKNSINYTVYKNSTLLVKIIEKNTMRVVAEKSILITSINTGTTGLGQLVTMQCEMSLKTAMYDCEYYLYNYDTSKYRYEYSEDTGDFEIIPISSKNLPEIYENTIFPSIAYSTYKKNDTDNFYTYKRSYYSNTKAKIRIIDIETNESIGIFVFDITKFNNFTDPDDPNNDNIFDIFKKFSINNEFGKIISNLWGRITSSKIYNYFLILIVGTIIVLIIKAMNR